MVMGARVFQGESIQGFDLNLGLTCVSGW